MLVFTVFCIRLDATLRTGMDVVIVVFNYIVGDCICRYRYSYYICALIVAFGFVHLNNCENKASNFSSWFVSMLIMCSQNRRNDLL